MPIIYLISAMIISYEIYHLISFCIVFGGIKKNLIILSIVIIIFIFISVDRYKYEKIEHKISSYEQQLSEIKIQQYDIKDKNSEEYKKNEKVLLEITTNYNKQILKYNAFVKDDKNRFALFRWYFEEKECI